VLGIAAGALVSYAIMVIAASFFGTVHTLGALSITAAAVVLIAAAIGASLLPAARASRVDVLQALRSE
jgi:ABC-type antimicrobial peptide transport system permease subunit